MKQTILVTCCLITIAAIATGDAGGERFYKGRSYLHRRTNGAVLAATASVTNEPAQAITLSWTLDYTGPRQPFTILKPSLRLATGQTVAVFHTGGKEYRLASPFQHGKYASHKSWFLTLPKGEKARGEILVPVSQVKKYFLKHWPEAFDKQRPPDLRVQLVHKPHDRGVQHTLDAWTGDLYTSVLEVKLENW